MRMIIRYENEVRVQAVLLAANHRTIRAAVENQSDCVELLRVNDSWQTDDGQAIEIEALIQVPDVDASSFCSEMQPRTMTAGSWSDSFVL